MLPTYPAAVPGCCAQIIFMLLSAESPHALAETCDRMTASRSRSLILQTRKKLVKQKILLDNEKREAYCLSTVCL